MKNLINPKKLLLSKWTCVSVSDKEKHFLVTKVHGNMASSQSSIQVTMEAVLTKNTKMIRLDELKDKSLWLQGWL